MGGENMFGAPLNRAIVLKLVLKKRKNLEMHQEINGPHGNTRQLQSRL